MQKVPGMSARMPIDIHVRVFHPIIPSCAMYGSHADDMKRSFRQHVHDITHGVFTPFVLSTSGGMVREEQNCMGCLAFSQEKMPTTHSWAG